jgi:DUF4097 and DUF4098 domain-containing protein YvlB
MTKNEFIGALCMKLRNMPAEEAQKTVLFYSEAIDDRMEDGLSEDDAVAAMGDIDDIVHELLGETANQEQTDSKQTESDHTFEKNEYKFSAEGIRNLSIHDSSFDTFVTSSNDDEIHVYCTEADDLHYDIKIDGDTLSIRKVDTRWNVGDLSDFKNIKDLHDLKKMIVSTYTRARSYTPGKEYRNLIVAVPNIEDLRVFASTSSGDITVKLYVAESFDLKSSSGDIEVSYIDLDSLNAATSSGDIKINYVGTTYEMLLSSTSGDIKACDVNCQRFSASASSGDIELKNCKCDSTKVTTVSGDSEITNLNARDKAEFHAISGEIDASLSEFCRLVEASTTSGDIFMYLPGTGEEYRVDTSTISGNCSIKRQNIPSPGTYGFSGKTISGNIEVEFRG